MVDGRKVGRYTPVVARPDLVALAEAMGLPNPLAVRAEGGWWVSTMTDRGATGLWLVASDGSLKRIRTNAAAREKKPSWEQGRLL